MRPATYIDADSTQTRDVALMPTDPALLCLGILIGVFLLLLPPAEDVSECLVDEGHTIHVGRVTRAAFFLSVMHQRMPYLKQYGAQARQQA